MHTYIHVYDHPAYIHIYTYTSIQHTYIHQYIRYTRIYIHTHIHIYIRVFVCKIQNVEYKIGVKESDKWYDVQIDGMYIWRRNSKEAV